MDKSSKTQLKDIPKSITFFLQKAGCGRLSSEVSQNQFSRLNTT